MEQVEEKVATIGDALQEHGLRLAVAESLTGGQICSQLASGPSASQWFAGGLVTYTPETKFAVLDVPEGPVVTEDTARHMAAAVAELLDVGVAVSATGVGGPTEEEGEPPGTVWLALRCGDHEEAHRFELIEDDPGVVLERTVEIAIGVVHTHLTAGSHDHRPD